MTLQSQSLSYCHSRCNSDALPTDMIEPSQITRPLSVQSNSIRHSLPTAGLRYRSDAYHSATVAQLAKLVSPACEFPAARPKAVDYNKMHRLYIQQRLQHRIAVAMTKDDQRLVNLLQHEMRQVS